MGGVDEEFEKLDARIAQLTAELAEAEATIADVEFSAYRHGLEDFRDAEARAYTAWAWSMLGSLYAISVYHMIVVRQGIDWVAILKMSEENRKRAEDAIAREQAAQAEAAAMRLKRDQQAADALEMHRALGLTCTCDNARTCRRCLAMDGTAGRALAARVPLWRDLERLVRGGCTPLDERVGDLLFKLAALDAQEPK